MFSVSFSALSKRNRGCYSSPFSGVGMEFFPPGLLPDQTGILLHETGYLKHNDWWNFPNTLSPFWRFYYNFRPGHKVVFPEAEHELRPEFFMLIPDRQLFHSAGRNPVPHLWMTFQVAHRLDARHTAPILLSPSPLELDLIRQLTVHFTGVGEGNRDSILHLSLALLHLIMIRQELHWQMEKTSPAINRAARQVESEYANPLLIQDLARCAGLSVRRFSEAFKNQQGLTPGQFITMVRVRESARMLTHTEDSIEQIAEKNGFPNRHYFSRVFKRLTRDSPAHFRQKHSSQPEPLNQPQV